MLLKNKYLTAKPGSFINLASMCDSGDNDKFRCIIDEVNCAPITDSNAPLVPVAFQLLASCGPGIVGQCQDLAVDPVEQSIVQSVQFLLRGVLDLERVLSHGDVCVSVGLRDIAR